MRTIPTLLSGIVLCIPLLSHASEKLLVQVPAVLDPTAPINEAVKRECAVEALVGNHVFQAVSERFADTGQLRDVPKAGRDKVLQLTILSVHGVGGGGWSGPKSISVRADLRRGGKSIQSKVLQRHSTGGFLGGISGTCPIMERIAVTLGKDVANWLTATTPGSASQLP
jgi:hypothetical protein